MLESIFTRDHPGTTDPDVVDAFVEKEIVNGDSVPTGTYLDMTANLPLVDPARVLCPVLLVKGEYDGISTLEDLQSLLRQAAQRRPPTRRSSAAPRTPSSSAAATRRSSTSRTPSSRCPTYPPASARRHVEGMRPGQSRSARAHDPTC